MRKLKKIGIWGNTEKKSFWKILPGLLDWSKNNNLEVFLTTRIINNPKAKGLKGSPIETSSKFNELDFILSLGGDGTFLSLSRALGNIDTPILGIHLGDLGFLAKVVLSDLYVRLNQVILGDFQIEKRMLIKASILKPNKKINFVALNDFVFTNGESHRMLSTLVEVDSHFVGNYKSDGLIISTPTGSTAYSLSAGGPIVTPGVDSVIITPTSAHTLTSRPIVIPGVSKITIAFSDADKSILFIADGQIHDTLDPFCKIEITKTNYSVSLIDFKDTDYFDTLRIKMGWGKRG